MGDVTKPLILLPILFAPKKVANSAYSQVPLRSCIFDYLFCKSAIILHKICGQACVKAQGKMLSIWF